MRIPVWLSDLLCGVSGHQEVPRTTTHHEWAGMTYQVDRCYRCGYPLRWTSWKLTFKEDTVEKGYWTAVFKRAKELVKERPNWTADACYLQARRELDAPRLDLGVDHGA